MANVIPKYVRAKYKELMATDVEKQRARWRRNKKAARERSKPTERVPDANFKRRVKLERNRRIRTGIKGSPGWREGEYFDKDALTKAVTFAADVWEATILIEYQLGQGKATPTRIAHWLSENCKDQGYSAQSLRKMVYVARERIAYMEASVGLPRPGDLTWHPFKAGT